MVKVNIQPLVKRSADKNMVPISGDRSKFCDISVEMSKFSQHVIDSYQNKPTRNKSYLYHFTNLDSFKKIIKYAQIFLTDSRFVNDSVDSVMFYRNFLEKSTQWKEESQKGSNMEKIFDEISKSSNLENNITFVLSLSKSKDRISQWHLYGDGGRGFAIAFDRDLSLRIQGVDQDCDQKIDHNETVDFDDNEPVVTEFIDEGECGKFENIPDDNSISEKISSMTSDCIYPSYTDKKMIMQAFFDKIKKDYKGKHRMKDDKLNEEVQKILVNVRSISSFIKHRSFSTELERRIAYCLDMDRYINEIKMRDSGNIMKPYIVANFCKRSVREVLCGPRTDDNSIAMIDIFLKKHGYSNVQVVKADLPYRG